MSVSQRPAPQLKLATLSSDGRVKAVFADSSVLAVSSNGAAFVHTDEGGNQIKQLSEFVVSRYAAQLAVALRFRNSAVGEPSMCSCLLKGGSAEAFTLGHRISSVWWPGSVQQAERKQLVQRLPDGQVAVSTEDLTAKILLHGHRRRFAVCFPLLVRQHGASFEYVWHTQLFSVQDYPARWQPAVALALAVAAAAAPPTEQAADQGQQRWQDQSDCDQDASCRSRQTQLPSALLGAGGAACAEAAGGAGRTLLFPPHPSWWSDPAADAAEAPADASIVLQWTPDATYQFHAASGEVEAWLHCDESCLASSHAGRFLAHARGPAAAGLPPCETMYAAGAVPEFAWEGGGGGRRYALSHVALRALAFRRAAAAAWQQLLSSKRAGSQALAVGGSDVQYDQCAAVAAAATATAGAGGGANAAAAYDAAFEVLSTDVVEQCIVDDSGRYTAFGDGRVRVCFLDRTILELSRDQGLARLLLPDGTQARVCCDQPVGVEAYVAPALQFAAWAFKGAEQRLAEAEAAWRAEAEAEAARRMAALCGHAASRTVPSLRQPGAEVAVPRSPLHQQVADGGVSTAVSASWQHCSAGSDAVASLHTPSHLMPEPPVAAGNDPDAAASWSASVHLFPAVLSPGTQAAAAAAAAVPFHARQELVESLLRRNADMIARLSA